MQDTITPELAEKYTRQTIAINRMICLFGIGLASYRFWIDIVRWHHNVGDSYATAFALHATLCVLWVVFFMFIIFGENIFSRSYWPLYNPKQYDFASFTAPKLLKILFWTASVQMTVQTFRDGGRLSQASTSYLTGETLFALAGVPALNILLSRRIPRRRKHAVNG